MTADELPEGWEEVTLSTIVIPVPNIKPEDEPNRTFHYVDIASIDNEQFRITETKAISGEVAPSRARRPVQVGDVLFSNVRTYLRNIAVVTEGLAANVCSTGFTVLRPSNAVLPLFLFRYVLTREFIDQVTPEQTGTHYPATSDRVVLSQTIPLPPLAEQRRIVAAVERILGKVSAARARLERVPTTLKRFRQAVLAAACSGRLTADWRGTDQTTGWVVTTLESVIREKPKNGFSPKSVDRITVVKSLTLTATTSGVFNQNHFKYLDIELEKDSHLWLKPDDILIQRGNTAEYVGVSAIYDGKPCEYIYPDLMMKVRAKAGVDSHFLWRALSEEQTRNYLRENATGTAGSMPKINQAIVCSTPINLPPFTEQQEIVRRVSAVFARADAIEARAATALKRVEGLTQAVLAKAFRGELVPTEADLARRENRSYEPARELLTRIRSTPITPIKPTRARKPKNPTGQ